MEDFEKKKEKKKDKRFLLFVCIVAVIGGINILITGSVPSLLVYLFGMTVSILLSYFTYSICKRGNRWRTFWTHQNQPSDAEPSRYLLITTKISAWSLYGLCLFFSLLTTFL